MSAKSCFIRISPDRPLLDDDIDIKVYGVAPRALVTLVCRVEENHVRYFATAYYRSYDGGVINVKTSHALPGGSYVGIEPMGLIWSQKQEPGQKPGRRLAKLDVTTPLVTHFYVLAGKVTSDGALDLIRNNSYLAHSECHRLHMAEGVQRIEVRKDRLQGTMFIPAGVGPHPGVIDLFGTVGGTVEHRSALLASRGVAAFTVCYFTPGKGEGLVTDIEYFEEAIELLLRHPKVRKPHIGIIGVSKGGELALLISALCHQVRACVEINGISFVSLVDHTYKNEEFPSCWLDIDVAVQTNKGVAFKDIYTVVTAEDHETYGIPIERGMCDYLLVHGADDQSMPPLMAEKVSERLAKHDKKNYRVLMYPETGHLIEPPHSPHFYSTYHAMFANVAVWGGTPREHARAQEDAWKQIIHFFKTKLTGVTQLKNKL